MSSLFNAAIFMAQGRRGQIVFNSGWVRRPKGAGSFRLQQVAFTFGFQRLNRIVDNGVAANHASSVYQPC